MARELAGAPCPFYLASAPCPLFPATAPCTNPWVHWKEACAHLLQGVNGGRHVVQLPGPVVGHRSCPQPPSGWQLSAAREGGSRAEQCEDEFERPETLRVSELNLIC